MSQRNGVNKFCLHGWFGQKNQGKSGMGDWRSLCVAMTLVDFIRRKELSSDCEVDLYNTPLARETGPAILIKPGEKRYINVVPEQVPEIIKNHLEGELNHEISLKQCPG